jgi:nicotinamidase-related amidase
VNALLVIDIQVSAFKNANLRNTDKVVERINSLSTWMRDRGEEVIYIQHDGEAAEGFAPHTPGWELFPGLNRTRQDQVIRKTICDSFYHTDLHQTLQAHLVDHLIITGWSTGFCVDTTIRAAVSLGYRVSVAADAHTSADKPPLTAEQVIAHHHNIWRNLITPDQPITVLPTDVLIQSLSLVS